MTQTMSFNETLTERARVRAAVTRAFNANKGRVLRAFVSDNNAVGMVFFSGGETRIEIFRALADAIDAAGADFKPGAIVERGEFVFEDCD